MQFHGQSVVQDAVHVLQLIGIDPKAFHIVVILMWVLDLQNMSNMIKNKAYIDVSSHLAATDHFEVSPNSGIL